MPRRTPWLWAALVATACASPGCGPAGESPPSVVLISIDTLRHDFVGCGGALEGTTPALDRIARQGVVFSNAVSTTSWTLPSHVSVLTGQYIESHGVHGDETSLHPDRETIAEFLRDRTTGTRTPTSRRRLPTIASSTTGTTVP